MKENLAALIKVKTIITIGVLIVFVVMALTGKIDPAQVMTIVTTVFAFYFGTQSEKRANNIEKEG